MMGKHATRTAPSGPAKPPIMRAPDNGFASAGPAAVAPIIPSSKSAIQAISDDDIRLRAYLKWEADGRPQGHDLFFWCQAERELRREIETAGQSSKTSA